MDTDKDETSNSSRCLHLISFQSLVNCCLLILCAAIPITGYFLYLSIIVDDHIKMFILTAVASFLITTILVCLSIFCKNEIKESKESYEKFRAYTNALP